MLCRTWARFMSLSEAQRLVSDADGKAVAATLPTVLRALTEHYRQGGEAFAKAALQRVVQLDQSNEDTRHVADTCLTVPSAAITPAAAVGAADGTAARPASRHLITELLRTYPHSPEIRERCCRCIANVCQLSAETQGTTESSTPTAASHSSSQSPLADALVAEGAVELVLGTLAMTSRLSSRGRGWAAMAMLNITCMSRSGAARATEAGAADRLAECVLFLLEDVAVTGGGALSAGPVRGLSEETATALDAALGALTAILAAEAPENASGISFNYEAASYTVVDAVVRALLYVSALLVRDGRNDGAFSASLPSRRYGTVMFPSASTTQQTAVVVLLPLLHKAWMALQAVSSCSSNLPMVFDVIYEAANANQESMMVENDFVSGGSEEVLEVTAQTERQYIAALSSLVEGALFLTTELEGLEAIGADELVRLQKDLRLNVMDTMQAITASRRDLARRAVSGGERAAGANSGGSNNSDATHNDNADGSSVYPTAAAMSVTDVLASGTVSNMALACAVRLHTEHQEQGRGGRTESSSSVTAVATAPYGTHDFALLSKSLLVLGNVADVGDEVATSANAVAALQAILIDAVEVVVSLPVAYRTDFADLFKPTEHSSDVSSTSSPQRGAIHEDDRLAFLQQSALIGQVYAVLWSTLRTAQGVTTVSQLRVLQTAREVQTALRESYLPAVEVAKSRYGKSVPASSMDEGDKAGDASAATTGGWVPNTAEETVVRLLKLSDELIDNLSKLSEPSSLAAHSTK